MTNRLAVLTVICLLSQSKPPLAFEAALVKPADPQGPGGGIRPLPGGQTYRADRGLFHGLAIGPTVVLTVKKK